MKCLYICPVLLIGFFYSTAQTTVAIVADKDNTIYSAFSNNSNGAGEYFFAGKNGTRNAGSLQRALLHFDLASVPAGAIISSATLTVYTDKTAPQATGIELRRMNAEWGEGTSDAAGREADGVAAAANDATWNQRIFPATSWKTAGGDFSPVVSGSVQSIPAGIGSATPISLSGQAILTDVQDWKTNPASNFGWMIKADNEDLSASVKRFVSRNSAATTRRPTLSITYSINMPVTLKGFSATLINRDASLKWTTSTESNNDYFEVEHSTNGKDFISIGRIRGNGTTNAEHSYTMQHENIGPGKHFYRLIDNDKNGNKRYSQVIALSGSVAPRLQLYPNPASTVISVSASSLLRGNEFTITSFSGQTVIKGIITEQQIDVQKLSSGQYLLTVKTTSGDLLKAPFLKR